MPSQPISVRMALSSLEEASEDVVATRAAYEAALASRDALIRDMRDIKVPVRVLAEVTHLSRDSILRIATSASRAVSPTEEA